MPRQRPAFEAIALLLQGGGALGAYQAGVYEALAAAEVMPTWVAGISIGAINAAIIAGNPPETRVSQMRGFWEQITSAGVLGWDGALGGALSRGDVARGFSNQISAGMVLTNGVAGFFKPRLPPPLLHPTGSLEATSYYDTRDLKATLERFVDFDRINAAEMRFSVGAVNVRSGNFVYFDTETHKIRAEHVMASGALPPGFPAIEIEGEYYWDGGLVSNTPLQWVIENGPSRDTLIFQVDLFQEDEEAALRARGPAGQDTGGAARHRRGQAPEYGRHPQRLQHRSSHLSRAQLRGRFEGLRVLASDHDRALARRAQRREAHVAPPGDIRARQESRGARHFRSCGGRPRLKGQARVAD